MTDIVNTAIQPVAFVTYLMYGLFVGVAFIVEMPIKKFCKIYVINVITDFITALFIGTAFIFLINYTSDGVLRAYTAVAYALGITVDIAIFKIIANIIRRIRERKKRNA